MAVRPTLARSAAGAHQCEISDRHDAEPAEPLQRGRTDAPQTCDRQRIEVGRFLPGRHLEHPVAGLDAMRSGAGLGLDGGHLGEELVRRHADRARQAQSVDHRRTDLPADRRSGAEQCGGPGDVEERLIERQRLDERRERGEDVEDVSARLGVRRVVARQEHRSRDELAGADRRHRRVDAVAAGLVRRGRDDTAAAGATHDDRLAAKLGTSAQLDRHEERVHVHVQDHRGAPSARGLRPRTPSPGRSLALAGPGFAALIGPSSRRG